MKSQFLEAFRKGTERGDYFRKFITDRNLTDIIDKALDNPMTDSETEWIERFVKAKLGRPVLVQQIMDTFETPEKSSNDTIETISPEHINPEPLNPETASTDGKYETIENEKTVSESVGETNEEPEEEPEKETVEETVEEKAEETIEETEEEPTKEPEEETASESEPKKEEASEKPVKKTKKPAANNKKKTAE